jgi:hypothetical protein
VRQFPNDRTARIRFAPSSGATREKSPWIMCPLPCSRRRAWLRVDQVRFAARGARGQAEGREGRCQPAERRYTA